MAKIVTFGELMLRLSPPGYTRLFQTNLLEATFGGGEANVAVALANLGEDAAFVTKLPDNAVGQGAVSELRSFGVDVTKIVRGGSRMGVYYCEKGASQRSSTVLYDRAASAIAEAKKSDFDWDRILEGCKWFHITGITPALSEGMADISEDACKAAKAYGATVSCDLNFRKKLWSSQRAGQVMSRLMQYTDICVANEEDAEKVFGISAASTDIEGGKLDHEGYIEVARQLTERFGFKKVAITLRGSISASDNNWAAMLYGGGKAVFSKQYPVHIVDRVGGGDSFCSGLIYSLINGDDDRKAIEFATALSCLKHSIEGDFCRIGLQEVEGLLASGGSGRIQR